MPELPDLHVFAQNLHHLVSGAAVASAVMHETRKNTLPVVTFAQAVDGARLLAVERAGKELLFSLGSGRRFCVHLMLHGKIALLPAAEVAAQRSKIMSLTFEDGRALLFTDFSAMCKVTLDPKIGPAPDAMSPDFDLAYLQKALARNARKTLKELLITQSVVRGIGNAYADEILYEANLSPEALCGRVPPDAAAELHRAVPLVMNDAIAQILRLSPERISGEERSFLRVHLPKSALTPRGEPIIVRDVAGKTTYFTAGQRMF